MKKRQSSFYPYSNLSQKSNYTIHSVVERDGTILERVFLCIPIPSLREKIICIHYLSRRVVLFYNKPIGFNIISRDNPWDFKIDFSSGELFNVEITSISENQFLFEKLKREERLLLNSNKEKIPVHEIQKLNYFFPSTEVNQIIESLEKSSIDKSDSVSNPFFEKQQITLGAIFTGEKAISELIKTAITKKEKKKHNEKEKTILIIDNRTFMYEMDDLNKAREELDSFLLDSSFLEIWFYTGYYSRLDGNDAEYSLAPLKITSEQEKSLEKFVKRNPPNNDGLVMT